MGVQRRYNQNLGEYEYYDALTEARIEYNPLTEGSGFFDIFFKLSIGGCKKAASKAAEAALESGMKKSWRESRRICIRQEPPPALPPPPPPPPPPPKKKKKKKKKNGIP